MKVFYEAKDVKSVIKSTLELQGIKVTDSYVNALFIQWSQSKGLNMNKEGIKPNKIEHECFLVEAGEENEEKEFIGLFSTIKKALKAVKNHLGQDYVEVPVSYYESDEEIEIRFKAQVFQGINTEMGYKLWDVKITKVYMDDENYIDE